MTYAIITNNEIMHEGTKEECLQKWNEYKDPVPMKLVKIETITHLYRPWH